MIKTLACRKAESTVLSNQAVSCDNTTMNQAQWAAELAARVWTITGTAERNGLEPLAYLTEILTACATAGGRPPQGPALERLLPWNRDPAGPGSRDHDPPRLTESIPTDPTGQGP